MKRHTDFPYLPKDFIETAEGLIFAVVITGPQSSGKVGCFLRYVRSETGWRKVATDEANQILTAQYPHYLYYSTRLDADFHAVSPDLIVRHHQPEQRLKVVLSDLSIDDDIITKCRRLIPILVRHGADCNALGLTGSMLIGQQKAESDIDLVVYGRDAFVQLRSAVRTALEFGELSPLDDALMKANYIRRAGSLNYNDFAWHENRKLNKAVIDGTKFDIGMVCLDEHDDSSRYYQKQGHVTLMTTVVDDRYGFDFPASYQVSDETISEVLVYTQTYVGQAFVGEQVEISGAIESDSETGESRLIVGSTREAIGEYIKVCR